MRSDAEARPAAPRPRREWPEPAVMALRPLFRYDRRRRAYVLRGLGNRMGPVIRPRSD
jgi:hypothetical protein